jgi:four helix bundle protein
MTVGNASSAPNDDPAGAKRGFDLEERTARFGEAVIAFCKKVPQNVVTLPLIGQLVKSATSVGANYCEADDAVSKKEFRCKIGTCKKEARESKHWLRMIASAEESMKDLRVSCGWRQKSCTLYSPKSTVASGEESAARPFGLRHSGFFRHSAFDLHHSC